MPSNNTKRKRQHEGETGGDPGIPYNDAETAEQLANDIKNRNPKDTHNRGPCVHCNATGSPQWRDGPLGCKTACNACGIKFTRNHLPGYPNPDKAKKPGQPAAKRRRASSELSDNDVIYMGSDNIAPHQPSDDAGLTTNHKTNEGPLGQATQCIVRPEGRRVVRRPQWLADTCVVIPDSAQGSDAYLTGSGDLPHDATCSDVEMSPMSALIMQATFALDITIRGLQH